MCNRKSNSTKHRKLHWLYELQDGNCFYCRRKCVIVCKPPLHRDFLEDQATFEHRLPRKLGGGNDEGNLVMACASCNNIKGDGPVYALLAPIFSHPMDYVPDYFERKSNVYA